MWKTRHVTDKWCVYIIYKLFSFVFSGFMFQSDTKVSVLVEAEAKRKAITEFRPSLHIFKLFLHVS